MTKRKIANWLLNPDNPGDLPLAEVEQKIKELGLDYVYRKIELPLIKVIKEVEDNGIKIDIKRLEALKKKLEIKLKRLEKKIHKLAGEEFNVNSPKQVSRILFGKLGLDSDSKTGMTKGGIFSTKAEELRKLRGEHPIIDLTLEYRETAKILGTYLSALTSSSNRIHTTLVQTGAATGRLSSQNPNLQNIPPVVKNLFIAESGYKLVALDYSQVELRILASLSQDNKMISAFSEGKDIHQMTASQIFNLPLNKVNKKMRQLAKTLNFGVAYGMGPLAFAGSSGLTVEEAKKFIKEYFSDFQEVKRWQENLKKFAGKNGYIENLNGRRRWLPAINSQNRRLTAEAERIAINMPVQSLGADIIKLAMIKVWRKYKNNDSVRLLLSIHDELLFEIKSDKVKAVASEIKELMENVYQLPDVKLEVDVKMGEDWGVLN